MFLECQLREIYILYTGVAGILHHINGKVHISQ
jgi:hypothetical protein